MFNIVKSGVWVLVGHSRNELNNWKERNGNVRLQKRFLNLQHERIDMYHVSAFSVYAKEQQIKRPCVATRQQLLRLPILLHTYSQYVLEIHVYSQLSMWNFWEFILTISVPSFISLFQMMKFHFKLRRENAMHVILMFSIRISLAIFKQN